jgi:hypothetical protein
MPKYNIDVQLTGTDGNAFAILGKVHRALCRANVPREEVDQFMREAKFGDYDNLLATCCKWVNVT